MGAEPNIPTGWMSLSHKGKSLKPILGEGAGLLAREIRTVWALPRAGCAAGREAAHTWHTRAWPRTCVSPPRQESLSSSVCQLNNPPNSSQNEGGRSPQHPQSATPVPCLPLKGGSLHLKKATQSGKGLEGTSGEHQGQAHPRQGRKHPDGTWEVLGGGPSWEWTSRAGSEPQEQRLKEGWSKLPAPLCHLPGEQPCTAAGGACEGTAGPLRRFPGGS